MKNGVNRSRHSRPAKTIQVRDLSVGATDASAVKAGIFDAFAKPPDIKGEVQRAGSDKDWIEVWSYSHG